MTYPRLRARADHYARYAIAATIIDGMPVCIMPTGHYPDHILPDGTLLERDACDRREPYVEISASSGRTLVCWYDGSSHRQYATIEMARPDAMPPDDPDAWFAAVEAAMPDIHAARNAQIAAKNDWIVFLRDAGQGGGLSRDEYEALCEAHGVEIHDDTYATDYATLYGQFSPSDYSLGECKARLLAARRGSAIKACREHEAAAAQERERAERSRQIEAAQSLPVVRRYRSIGRGGVGAAWIAGDEVHVVVETHGSRRVSEDDPSIYGPHLLGREGDRTAVATIAVHPRASG